MHRGRLKVALTAAMEPVDLHKAVLGDIIAVEIMVKLE